MNNPFKHHNVVQFPSADDRAHQQEFTAQQAELYCQIAGSYGTLRTTILSVLGSSKSLTTEIDGLGEVTLNHVSEKAVSAVIRSLNTKQVVQATRVSDDELLLTHVLTVEKTNPKEKTVTDTEAFMLKKQHAQFDAQRNGVPVSLDTSTISEKAARLKAICEQLGVWALDCAQPATIG